MSLEAIGCPIEVDSVRGRLSDCVGNGNSVRVIAVTPDNASGSARLLGELSRLDAPWRASVINRDAPAPVERSLDVGAASGATRGLGACNEA